MGGDWDGNGGVRQSLAWASDLEMCFVFMQCGLPLISMVEMHLGFQIILESLFLKL